MVGKFLALQLFLGLRGLFTIGFADQDLISLGINLVYVGNKIILELDLRAAQIAQLGVERLAGGNDQIG